jgi:unsaturated rhamnogalacturonyl hydrolase
MRFFNAKTTASALALTLFAAAATAQSRVTLDNFYNHETNPKTHQAFHYLWSDQANSGFSQWGDLFRAQGATIDTLGQAPTAALLKGSDVYIIVDPDTRAETAHPNYIEAPAIAAIDRWVKAGGVLVLMANDSGNCEFTHLNQLAATFGLHFNEVSIYHVTGHHYEMGAITGLPDYPPFKNVQKIYMKEISTLTTRKPAYPVLEKDSRVILAESRYGKGLVVAVGDPWIYNEYIGHRYLPQDFQNHLAAEQFTGYLLARSRQARGK